MQLVDKYNITAPNLELRRKFIGLDAADARALASVAGWARRAAPTIARQFYDFQFSFPATLAFFEKRAAMRKMSLQALREHLEAAQTGYITSIFEEAADGDFGLAYFDRRLNVGKIHNQIDLPLKWYLGSYPLFQRLLREELRRSMPWRFGLRARVDRALGKVFNYDMQAVCDAFFLDLVESLGIDVASMREKGSDRDLAERFDVIKSFMGELLGSLSRASKVMTQSSSELSETVRSLNSRAQSQAASLEETAAAMEEIGAAAGNANEHASKAMEMAVGGEEQEDCAVTAIREIRSSSDRISQITSVIDEIAFQTNLLALNAAVEAARAGDHGRGFAVVAGEVRALAQRSAEAAREIKGLIDEASRRVVDGSGFVERMAEMVTDIATGASEQSRALQEVGIALGELDRGTQEGAHQTEALSGMADALAGQASDLRALVARFRTEGGEGRRSGTRG
ncbi:MAG: globin-coupled sensor protein [Ectothiorhodospiraceae bacterium]|nr:globin-coupled sensor protein [Chromatiales bacterium]MCP5154678.1 globin-coupled sensor protein [Ectothiorhodospiraceae bacterium]